MNYCEGKFFQLRSKLIRKIKMIFNEEQIGFCSMIEK